MRPALEVADVERRHSASVLIGPLTFSVDGGTILGLAGANGAGKTTLLRLVCGLLRSHSGSIRVLGHEVLAGHAPRDIGVMIEEPALYPWASARQQMLLAAAGRPSWVSNIDRLLQAVELHNVADRPIRAFSQGMRQRLGIARALLGDPKLILLDEPTNGLDPQGVRWLRGFLRTLAASDCTVVVSSHLLSELHQLADQFIIMSGGKMIAKFDGGEIGTKVGALDEAYFELIR